MKIDNVNSCRGDGVILSMVALSGVESASSLTAQAETSDGKKVPCYCRWMNKVDDMPSFRAVIVLPLMAVSHMKVQLRAEDSCDGSALFIIDLQKVKWESRWNYRFQPAFCASMKDCLSRFEYEDINFEFFEAVHDGADDILHGHLRMPFDESSRVHLYCLDDCGERLASEPIVLGEASYTSKAAYPMKVRDIGFSVRIPNDVHSPCVVAEDEATGRVGFGLLEPGAYQHCFEVGYASYCTAQTDPRYEEWFKAHRATLGVVECQKRAAYPTQPVFSIVVPLYKTPLDLLGEMVESVRGQSYQKWELLLVNASKEDAALTHKVEEYCSQDARLQQLTVEENRGITENTNVGLLAATGDFVCFLDHDDTLEPDVLFEYAKAIQEHQDVDLLYCDEDKLRPDGSHFDAFFKPDFSIDLLRNNNYICHFLCVRKDVIDSFEPATSVYDGAQDHNLTLKVVEKARYVHHVPKILYHWRVTDNSTAATGDNKPYATIAGVRAVQEHLDRLGIDAEVTPWSRPATYKVRYRLKGNPLISIVIPNKDNREALEKCIGSILNKTTYANYEIVVVENNSVSDDVFEYYQLIQKDHSNIRVVTWPDGFNYSKIINFGAEHSKGEILLLLNNDMELITPDWLEIMLGYCMREDVGAVGARLLYPDDTIQHAGVVVTDRKLDVAGHPFTRFPRSSSGYFAFADAVRNYSAVTAACMMVKKTAFDQAGGFDENLSVAYNDVDFCLKLRKDNNLIVYTPEVELYHFESLSRGDDLNESQQIRYMKEVAYMRYHWAEFFLRGDPYFNQNLESGYFKLRW